MSNPTNNTHLHADLQQACSLYAACGIDCSPPEAEAESADYAAHTFRLNGLSVCYRAAKITPTKTGQFVTIWKRSKEGPIEPFHISDDLDLIIISVRKEQRSGQFIFPKAALADKGIVSRNGKEGKRGIRVYPPWDTTTSKQAQQTQRWQLEHFVETGEPGGVEKLREQFSKEAAAR